MLDLTGFKLTFDDEFNTRSISKSAGSTTWGDIRSAWKIGDYADIGFGHSSFVDSASGYDPFKVSNGALTITAGGDVTSSGYPGSMESGLITTQGSFSQKYGYFEMRADLSDAKGGWDAFWMMPNQARPDPNNAGGWQELDVVEHYAGNNKGVYSTIHTTDQTPNIPWQQNRQVYSEVADASGYHTYGANWQPDKISFYVDGKFVGSQATPSDMHDPMYMMANLATQDGATTDGQQMKIDYIRAYSNDPGARAVVQGVVSAPDGRDPGLYGANSAGSIGAPSPTSPIATSVGSGSDQLVFKISQDAYKGDAQYTVSVDGKQIGGTLTAHASHAAGQSDTVTLKGDWAVGDHKVSVNFLNDAYDGTASTDRNLYVDTATYNDAAVSGSQLALKSAGTQAFTLHDTSSVAAAGNPAPTSTTPASTTPSSASSPIATSVGSGSDQLVFKISQDAYKGDAQYTVSVDGKQIGGTLTAHASHAAGQSDTVTLKGDWAVGDHKVSVNFLNDAYDGTASTDRNLYVDTATYNDAAVSGSQLALKSAGTQAFTLHDTSSVAAAGNPAPTSTTPASTTPSSASSPIATSVGSGSDQLVFKISQDAYKGDAQYTVSVDGKQIGGTLTAHASHAAVQSDTVTLKGDWAVGDHKVSVNFLNDAYDGTASTDRNLYVDTATYNGAAVSGSHLSLMSSGSQALTVHDYHLA